MFPLTRGRLLVAAVVVSVALLLTGLVAYAFSDATIESADDVESALPTTKDMRDWSANRGVIGTLPPPKGDKDGKLVLTRGKLDKQCEVYRKKSHGWACDGIRGLGMVGYAYDENVFTRVSSVVLAYEDEDAAEAAWQTMTDKTRTKFKEYKAEESSNGQVGDESRSFAIPSGTVVVMRSGSVVAQAMSHNEFGFDNGDDAEDPGGYSEPDDVRKDPIGKWSSLQAEKVEEALSGS